MKINNQIWDTLEIFGNFYHRETIMSNFENIMIGSEIRDESSILYFTCADKNEIDNFLEKNNFIDKWIWSKIKETNWNKSCEDFFKTITISNKIKISPYWKEQNKDYLNIIINPALAFGTGHHETTQLMIKSMLEFDFRNKSVFDIGTGSGILSILAKKLGANNLYAIDDDSLAYNNFFENLEFNNFDKKDIDFEIKDCFEVDNFKYDFILANINSMILEKLIPKINNTNGILILSGILDTDERKIVDIIKKSNKKIKKKNKINEWLCLIIEL